MSAQGAPPSTLVFPFDPLHPAGADRLQPAPPTAGPCGSPPIAPGASQPSTSNFKFTPEFPTGNATGNATGNMSAGPAGGGHYHVREPVTVVFVIGAPMGQQFNSGAGGLRVTGELKAGGATNKSDVKDTPPRETTPQTVTLTFPINETGFVAHMGGEMTLTIVMTARPAAMGVPVVPFTSAQLHCGPNSKMTGLKVVRGAPGDGDIDGDGNPDTLDTDKDGDGVPNATEARLLCRFNEAAVDFSSNRAEAPGDHDNDGASDERECAKGFNPLSSASIPPRDRSILDILLPYILILVLVGLVAGIVFAFMKYGKTVAVTVASTSELFIPPGSKGKYEVAVENLAKKGEPRTFQLVVEGMPEGWDAKLNTDHLTLDPAGGAQSRSVVWLEVESPQRPEPESAVVKVKAIPLNKAGRKDTLKLPGKAETITSINVPPGSKVPVKRGGKVVPAEPKDEAPAAGVPIATLGVDEPAAKKLAAAGVENSEQLRTADPGALAKKTKIPEGTLTSWRQVADLVRLGTTPAQAGALAATGTTSIGKLANAEPKDVMAAASIDEKTAKAWVKAAEKFVKKHPAEAVGAPAAAAAAAPPAAPGAAPAAKPQLQVGGLKHEPPAFRQGETVKSSVNVANNGPAASTLKLSLYVNDGLADVQTVTVKPGKAKDVQFKWTAQDKNKLNIRGEVVPS